MPCAITEESVPASDSLGRLSPGIAVYRALLAAAGSDSRGRRGVHGVRPPATLYIETPHRRRLTQAQYAHAADRERPDVRRHGAGVRAKYFLQLYLCASLGGGAVRHAAGALPASANAVAAFLGAN